jgi:hypothetical protein
MELKPQDIIHRYEKLKAARGVLTTHWQELADYNIPRKNNFIRIGTPGEKKGVELYDSTSMVSCDILSSALHGMLTNPNSLWFMLGVDNEELNQNEFVVEYLQELTRRLHGIMNNSNFQTEVHEFYLDLCAFGTAVMTIEEDEKNIVRFSTKHLNDIYIKENFLGAVDTVYRCFKWDARQIVEAFGKELADAPLEKLEAKFGRRVAMAYKNNTTEEFEIVHCVYNDDMSQLALPFYSTYVLVCEKIELKSGRFKRLPYIVSRWTKVSGEVYGRSPAMNALPEAKTLNVMAKTVIKGAQKVVDPPMQMPDDGFVRPLRTAPGSVNYYRAGTQDLVKPIFNDTRIDFGIEIIRERQAKVQQAFYIDRLNLQQNDRMTTIEVTQRVQEQLRFMGPMLGRQQTEFLKPTIDRLLDIAVERDGGSGLVIGTPPPEIQNVELDVRYTSPVARAQRTSEAESLQQALAASAPMLQLDPSAADIINPEMVVKENWSIYGAPQKLLRKKAEIEAIRSARQQAQQAALKQQQQMAQSEMVNNVAPALPKQ